MKRLVGVIVLASAFYGFCVGRVHSLTYAERNLLKFPLLIFVTGGVCALAYALSGLFITRVLKPADVLKLGLETFRDLSVLLASLGPACLFLALSIRQPDKHGLNEYPFYLGLNVVFIALAGSLALVRQALSLLRRHQLSLGRSLTTMGAWLLLSLLVGGQSAWYLRPFFGISTVPIETVPFFQGTQPDPQGATSFYEAVFHILVPPERIRASGRQGLP